VDDGAVPDAYAVADDGRESVIGVNDGAVRMLESSPISIASVSPRMTAKGHTEARWCSVTFPQTNARG
jgi:hypothetical protein